MSEPRGIRLWVGLLSIIGGGIMLKLKQKGHAGERGQGLVEYALILVLVAIVVIVILAVLGPAISVVLAQVTAHLNGGIAIAGSEVVSGGGLHDLHVTVVVTEDTNVTLDAGSGTVTESCTANEPCEVSKGVSSPSGDFTVSTDFGAEASGTY
jgi:pilus assembly protein Flp/PilA